ncbi:MAG: hypothetical protein ACE5H8_08850 [Alphaproteobacteria bacterium]
MTRKPTRATRPRKSAAAKAPAQGRAKKAAKNKATTSAAPTTEEMLGDLERFFAGAWRREPADVARLRRHALPPMGNMPCMLYANFNTFWLGENVQVLRQLALDKALPSRALNRMAAALLARHAARLAKWKLHATVRLLHRLVAYFEGEGAKTHREFVAVAEALMMAGDRINAWIDAAIPWSQLDAKVRPFPPAT